MNAQTSTLIGLSDLKIGLEGSLDVPVVVNHSGRAIIGYVLKVENDTGVPTIIQVFPSVGIPFDSKDVHNREQSGARAVHQDGTPVITSKVSLDAVVFADGQVDGPDTADSFRFLVAHTDAIRNFAVRVLADMNQMETTIRAHDSMSPREHIFQKTGEQMYADAAEYKLAKELSSLQQESGIVATQQVAYRLSQIPNLWKGERE